MQAQKTTHASWLLTIYLDNTREITDSYTTPAVDHVAGLLAFGATAVAVEEWLTTGTKVGGVDLIGRAIDRAVELVERREGVTPTAADIADATRRYILDIVDAAREQIADKTPSALELPF